MIFFNNINFGFSAASIPVGAYGNSYMEVPPPGGQLSRQDLASFHPAQSQDEFYPTPFSQLNKPFVTPFR